MTHPSVGAVIGRPRLSRDNLPCSQGRGTAARGGGGVRPVFLSAVGAVIGRPPHPPLGQLTIDR